MGSGFRYFRLLYTLFAFASFAVVILYQVNLQQVQLFLLTDPIFYAGLLICFGGLVLMIVCISKYFVGLSGIKALFKEETSNQLIISGVHRFVRHPLYLGTFVFIWGLLLVQPYLSLLIANTIITVYTLIGMRLEEAKLVDEFGEDYIKYQQTVPRILPGSRFTRIVRK